ncbi:hypothetical protein [Janthinobacterium sp.]|uniref:hypothetical protein n=1 Tax=Janthinobacterium sp. TaxID=1871054 RepID=UPI00293D4193|nr:hypothetical protein [Janthinobacterium sp.]
MSGRLIDLEQARAGMLLADDLTDANGTVLLPGGAALTEANLASLRRRGIESCRVAEAEAQEDEAARAQRHALAQQRLARLFRHSAEAEATPLLLHLLAAHRRNG